MPEEITELKKITEITEEIEENQLALKIPNSIFTIIFKKNEPFVTNLYNPTNEKKTNEEKLYNVYLDNKAIISEPKLIKSNVPLNVLKKFIKVAILKNKRSITTKRKMDKTKKTIKIILSRIENKKSTLKIKRSLTTK